MSADGVVGGADRAGGAEDDDQGGEPDADGGLAVVEAPGADAGEEPHAVWCTAAGRWGSIVGGLTGPMLDEAGRAPVGDRLCFG